MKVAVSMPKAENFDWDATYYALLSIGMYRTRVWGVGKSVDSLKQTVCESIDKTRGKVQANLLKKDIQKVTLDNEVVQTNHAPWRFAIAECDCKMYVLFNSNLCPSERFIFDDEDGRLKIKYAGATSYGNGKCDRRPRHIDEHIIR